jgi:hypothetical protein
MDGVSRGWQSTAEYGTYQQEGRLEERASRNVVEQRHRVVDRVALHVGSIYMKSGVGGGGGRTTGYRPGQQCCPRT